MTIEKTEGLTCPNCGGLASISEGARIVQCSYCGQHSLLRGERGVRRWQASHKIERQQAFKAVDGFFSGSRKASDLKAKAKIREIFLVYAPYWRVDAFVVGWVFGRLGQYKRTKLLEVEVMHEMRWNDAAVDMTEFGVHRVSMPKQSLEPYNPESLHREAMVFEATESQTEAMAQAKQYFVQQAKTQKAFDNVDSVNIFLLRPQLFLVYYPLWVARYEYRRRNYQVTVDGITGELLYGKAPGNISYRATILVASMAVGTFLATNGIALLLHWAIIYLKNFYSDELSGFPLCLAPLVILVIYLGSQLILAGYRHFRYGDEIEEIAKSAKKA